MTDVTELLRAANPAGSVELEHAALVRQARGVLAANRRRPSQRRRRLAVGASMALMLTGAGAATAIAAGVVPQAVVDAFDKIVRDSGQDEFELASDPKRVASATTDTGDRVELWVAPTKSNGSCQYLRTITSSGAEDGPRECRAKLVSDTPLPPLPLALGYELVEMNAPTVLYGAIDHPEVSSVYVTSGVTRVGSQAVENGGWIVVAINHDAALPLRVHYLSADGHEVGQQDITPRR